MTGRKLAILASMALLLMAASAPAQAFLWFGAAKSKDFKRLTRNAQRAMERRQWHEALVYLEEARRRYPGQSAVQLQLAYLHRQVGLLGQARGHAQDAVHNSRANNRDAALRELAWVEYRSYFYESALSQLAKLKKPLPADHALQARLWILKAEWDKALAALDTLEHASQESALSVQEAALVAFWRDWCLLWKHGSFSASASLADPVHGGAGLIFADKKLAKGSEVWTVLGRMAWRSLSGLPMDSDILLAAAATTDADKTDAAAWRMLRILR